MCNFISWIEKDNKVYFITDTKLIIGVSIAQQLGHSAIDSYYNLNGGAHYELPGDPLPKEIVHAYNAGLMSQMEKAAGVVYFSLNRRNYAKTIITESTDGVDKHIYKHERTKNCVRTIALHLYDNVCYNASISYTRKNKPYRSNGPSMIIISFEINQITKYYDTGGKKYKKHYGSRIKTSSKETEKYKHLIKKYMGVWFDGDFKVKH